MKKLLLLLAITISVSSFAQTKNMDITTVKKITTDEVVTSLKIYNNVEVMLTANESEGIQIVGEKTAVENTLVKIVNGELIISSSSEEFFKDRVLVFVPSTSLDRVYVHGASLVSSTGILSNENLYVSINGEGKSTVKTTGKINVNTVADFPLENSSK